MHETTLACAPQRSHFSISMSPKAPTFGEDTLETLHLSMPREGTCHRFTTFGNGFFLRMSFFCRFLPLLLQTLDAEAGKARGLELSLAKLQTELDVKNGLLEKLSYR